MYQYLLSFLMFMVVSVGLSAQTYRAPLRSDAWSAEGNAPAFVQHLGTTAMHLGGADPSATGGNMVSLKDYTFRNGTIEYDIAFEETTRFTSIHFRRADAKNSEHFYLRAFWAGHPRINTAIQYSAILNGVNIWDLSDGYQSAAPLRKTGWNHVKLVVKDQQLLAYVNDMESPALYVPEMDGDWSEGAIAFDGNAYVANLEIRPGDAGTLVGSKGMDPTHNDARYLRSWEVTTPQSLPTGTELTTEDLPTSATTFSPIQAEHHGIVNLSRRFGPTPRGERRVVWLRKTITSDRDQLRQLDFGFSDEVYVFVNQQPLYVDKNLYNSPMMKAPRGRASIENVRIPLPLQKGENEILVGLTNFFFGWGLVARLDDTEGLDY
ncbi:hypothetical protein [Lewinella sp. W8]|uniref:hypothetical protein n=1 Tax=Lewinella sp. W8 TaxID=2528208 RepID=UPI001068931E|nr:hypothetical protein [Lewinella sp. W8]MTB52449.1 hypothetical protein [Lewinella sp. W8]